MISIVNEQPFLAWKNVSKVIDMQLHFKPLLQPDFWVGDYLQDVSMAVVNFIFESLWMFHLMS